MMGSQDIQDARSLTNCIPRKDCWLVSEVYVNKLFSNSLIIFIKLKKRTIIIVTIREVWIFSFNNDRVWWFYSSNLFLFNWWLVWWDIHISNTPESVSTQYPTPQICPKRVVFVNSIFPWCLLSTKYNLINIL